MLAVLRGRNFALLWFAALISRLGDYALLVGLPYYVYQRTGSTLATGAILAAELGPEIALGSLDGVYVDRWDRRATMIVADLARAGVLLVLLALPSHGGLWLVYLVAAAQEAFAQFFNPASGALVPRVVGDAQLMTANALGYTMDNTARVVGPAIGGLLLGAFGLAGVVLVDAASFLGSAGLIVLVRVRVAPSGAAVEASEEASWRAFCREWGDGLDLVRRNRVLAALFVVWGITMLAQGILSTLWVPFVRGVLHGSAPLLGWIGTDQGVGGILGGLVAGRLGAVVPPRCPIVAGSSVAGLLLLAMVNLRAIPPILLLSVGVGVSVLLADDRHVAAAVYARRLSWARAGGIRHDRSSRHAGERDCVRRVGRTYRHRPITRRGEWLPRGGWPCRPLAASDGREVRSGLSTMYRTYPLRLQARADAGARRYA